MKLLIYPILFFTTLMFSQQTIKGTFSPPEKFTYAFLYKSTLTGPEYVNKSKTKEDGTFEFKLDSTVTSGIYKIVYGIPMDVNHFELIYNGKEDIELHYNLNEKVTYTVSKENILWNTFKEKRVFLKQKIDSFYAKKDKKIKDIETLFKQLKDNQISFENEAESSLVLPLIKTCTPYIPKQYEDSLTYFNKVKSTFFNGIDFRNNLVLSSDILFNHILEYVFKLSDGKKDSHYYKQIDTIVEAIGVQNETVKRILLEKLWYDLVKKKMSNLANYITDTYLLSLEETVNNTKLIKTLISFKNNSVGATAQDFKIPREATTLHKLDLAEQYLLIFWSSHCNHCIKQLPKIKALLEDEAHKNTKVIAFGLETNEYDWANRIITYPEFIHVIGLGKWDNPIVNKYDLYATPTFYILDKDKKIVAKPVTFKDLKATLNQINKQM